MNYLVLILMLCLGISLGLNVSCFLPRKKTAEAPVNTAEDTAAEKRRRQFEAEQKAFEQLMNYNSDVAYGVEKME